VYEAVAYLERAKGEAQGVWRTEVPQWGPGAYLNTQASIWVFKYYI